MRAYDLAGFPELDDVDDLFTGHDGERQCCDDLGPSGVREDVDDMGEDLGVGGGEVGREERVGKQKVGGDRGRPVCCEVEADEECLVGKAKDEQGAL